MNAAPAARPRATVLLVRFGGDGRPLKAAIALVALVALVTLPFSRFASAALLVVVPLVMLLRYQRRALLIVRPKGPLVVQGWWRRSSVAPDQVTRVDWLPGSRWAHLRLTTRDSVVACFSVAVPTSPKARVPVGSDWRGDVDALIDALQQVGVSPAALHGMHVGGR